MAFSMNQIELKEKEEQEIQRKLLFIHLPFFSL
jgi:hypothetical protein